MNIGIVCYPTYGGSGIVATELGMALAQKGNSVHFLSSSLPARLDVSQPSVFFHQVNVHHYPLFEYPPYSLALSSQIVQIAQKYQLDILHVHYAVPHASAGYFAQQILAKKGYHLPMVTTLHGTDITLVGQHPAYKCAVQFSINSSDAVTCVSESLKNDTYRVFEIEKDIKVIPNFIDLKLLNEQIVCQREKLAQPDEKIVVHVSNLRPVKRIADVVEIFYRIQKSIKSKLVIVGEGPDMEVLLQRLDALQISDKVHIFGKVQNLYSILSSCDLFLLPSEQESFGLAALEAMACGVPVISSNAGGISEVNKHGFSGYLFPIGAVDEMANAAIRILSDDTILKTFKENAVTQSKLFDKQHILPLYEEVYASLIPQKELI